jgi:DnaJ family protein C protein 10
MNIFLSHLKRLDSGMFSVGQVDCVVEQRLCAEQGITSYPNIRIYPSNSFGYSTFDQFQGWMRDANSLTQWATNYMPSVTLVLDVNSFENLVLKNFKQNDEQKPWIIDFYAPWCGHCQVFAPVFESLAHVSAVKYKIMIMTYIYISNMMYFCSILCVCAIQLS